MNSRYKNRDMKSFNKKSLQKSAASWSRPRPVLLTRNKSTESEIKRFKG